MSIENEIRLDGKTHRAILRFCTVTYWGQGCACGHDKAEQAVVSSHRGAETMTFAMPNERTRLIQALRLMSTAYTEGKRRAKRELREWMES